MLIQNFSENNIVLQLQSREDPQALQQTIDDLLPYFASGLTPNQLDALGMNRNEFLRRCVYDGAPCIDNQFVDKVDSESGKCFTFNGDGKLIAKHAGEPRGICIF